MLRISGQSLSCFLAVTIGRGGVATYHRYEGQPGGGILKGAARSIRPLQDGEDDGDVCIIC